MLGDIVGWWRIVDTETWGSEDLRARLRREGLRGADDATKTGRLGTLIDADVRRVAAPGVPSQPVWGTRT